jgi:monoamine oxidase
MSRLPNAFKPLIGRDLKYKRKIQKVHYLEEDKKVQVSWKNHYTDRQFQTATYDYTFVAVPFTVVRKWKLPGKYFIPSAMRFDAEHIIKNSLPP